MAGSLYSPWYRRSGQGATGAQIARFRAPPADSVTRAGRDGSVDGRQLAGAFQYDIAPQEPTAQPGHSLLRSAATLTRLETAYRSSAEDVTVPPRPEPGRGAYAPGHERGWSRCTRGSRRRRTMPGSGVAGKSWRRAHLAHSPLPSSVWRDQQG